MNGSADIGRILAELSSRTGLTFPPDRIDAAREAVLQWVARTNLDDTEALLERLRDSRDDRDELYDAVRVGETYFFRDRVQLDLVATEILPAIIRERPPDHVVAIWSAGCSTGEEPWTLAMIAAEAGLRSRTRIVGTDLSETAIEIARAGRYRPWSLRDDAATRAGDGFRERDGRFEVAEGLRPMVRFERHNLAQPDIPSWCSGLDLVLCRNVLIYFDDATIDVVANRLHDALAPGGWLMCGAADPPLGRRAPFEVVSHENGVVYRRQGPGRRARDEHAPPATHRPRDVEADLPPSFPPAHRRQSDAHPPKPPRVATPVATAAPETSPASAAENVRRLANTDPAKALVAVNEGLESDRTSVELHYLRASLLVVTDDLLEAAESVRRALFLDAELVVGHLLLGTIRRRLGDEDAARRAYENVHRLCRVLPGDAIVPLSDGECAGRLADFAARQLDG